MRLFFNYYKKVTPENVLNIVTRAPPSLEITTEYRMLIACHDGFPETVKSLLNANKFSSLPHDAIHLACSKGGKEIVEVLVHYQSCDVLEGGS